MLYKIELLVRTGCPEILTVINEVFVLLLAFLVGKSDRRLFTEGRIGQHIVDTVSRVCQQCITQRDRNISVNIPDIVQIQVHQCGFIGCRHNFISVKGFIFQKFFLLSVQSIIGGISKKRLSRKKKTAAAAAGIGNGFHRFGTQTAHHSTNQRTGSKVLSRTAFNVLCVLLQ